MSDEKIWKEANQPTRTKARNADDMLSETEVAARQGRSVKTLQNQRVLGGGIPFHKFGRTVRYRLADVQAWEGARRHASTSEVKGHD